MLAVLRAMDEEDFAALPDCGEGLSRRIYRAVRQGRTLEEVYTSSGPSSSSAARWRHRAKGAPSSKNRRSASG